MTNYTLTLTPLESACGVTLDAVAAILPLVLMIDNGRGVLMPAVDNGPALAGAVARCALGKPAAFSHLSNGYPVYVVA